jgi:hypothetical protein
MGSGLSSNHRGIWSSLNQPPARVIGADGSLREFPASCVPVSDVLAGDNAGRFFVCSSDALYFDAGARPRRAAPARADLLHPPGGDALLATLGRRHGRARRAGERCSGGEGVAAALWARARPWNEEGARRAERVPRRRSQREAQPENSWGVRDGCSTESGEE